MTPAALQTPPAPEPEERPDPDRLFFSVLKELYRADSSSDPEAWTTVLDKILPVNGPVLTTTGGDTPLMVALWVNKTSLADRLISAGCDVHHINASGQTIIQSMAGSVGGRFTAEQVLSVINLCASNPQSANAFPPPPADLSGRDIPDWAQKFLSSPTVARACRPDDLLLAVGYLMGNVPTECLSEWTSRLRAKSSSDFAVVNTPEWIAYCSKRALEDSVSPAADPHSKMNRKM